MSKDLSHYLRPFLRLKRVQLNMNIGDDSIKGVDEIKESIRLQEESFKTESILMKTLEIMVNQKRAPMDGLLDNSQFKEMNEYSIYSKPFPRIMYAPVFCANPKGFFASTWWHLSADIIGENKTVFATFDFTEVSVPRFQITIMPYKIILNSAVGPKVTFVRIGNRLVLEEGGLDE